MNTPRQKTKPKKCQIYLAPGFFGFSSLGSYNYFYRVKQTLDKQLKKHGINAEIINCTTQPTSSIHRRAKVILDTVKDSGGLDAQSLHFIGHSTGGLDVRLLVTPGVRLREDKIEDIIGRKTKSVTTISTPHFGTPLANFFTTLQGKRILQLLTTMAINKTGRATLFGLSQLLSLVSRLDNIIGRKDTYLDHLVERLFRHISLDPNDPIWKFLEEVKNDQGAIIQLTPEGMHLYNAAVADRENVDYRCVVTLVEKPKISHIIGQLTTPAKAASAILFSLLYSLTSYEHKHYPYPGPSDSFTDTLQSMVPFEISPSTSDGVSPALSQLYGELIDIEIADHLDIVGQFEGVDDKKYSDWLISGASFNEEKFQNVWSKIAEKIAESEKKPH